MIGKRYRSHAFVPWQNQEGVALLMVLWVLTLLTVIVGQFCYAMRAEINITRNFRDVAKAYFLARAGQQQALLWLLEPEQINGNGAEAGPLWRVNADNQPVLFGDGSFEIKIGNESGKINLNTAHPDLLKMMLAGLELSEEEERIIVDSIQDWRDADNLHRLNGAENDYYQNLPEPYSCHNGPFRSVKELLLVRGISKDIMTRLLERITIYPQVSLTETARNQVKDETAILEQKQININAAPLEVLQALPQMTDEALREIIDFRRQADFTTLLEVKQTVGDRIFRQISNYITLDFSSYFSLITTGYVKGSKARRSIASVVDVDADLYKYRIAKWLDFESVQ
ncbi:MAG: general secretion pathway protein GspK [Proteobacteria bacterium]|nr:general secretion pathway protein GspK [Pseudomonadota bacterium]MBU1715169.1 general secretion pathway protein GspK [Pseudomonadota bacterium]